MVEPVVILLFLFYIFSTVKRMEFGCDGNCNTPTEKK
jgi:hypothetical protein